MSGKLSSFRQNLTRSPFPVGAAALSALFLVLSLTVVAFLLDEAAERENEIARADSVHLARTALAGLHGKIGTVNKDYAFWEATVAFARDGKDTVWADGNIGGYLQDTFGITGSFVVDDKNATIYHASALKGPARPADAATLLGPQAEPLFAKARSGAMTASNSYLSHAIWDGTVFVIAAAPITSDVPSPRAAVRFDRPVLVLYQALAPETVAELGARYLLRELKVVTAVPAGLPGLPLLSSDGAAIAHLAWTPARPGDQLVEELLPRISLAVGILVVATAVVFVGWWRTAAEANEAKSRFLAKMSHELRTPLNPIMALSEAMTLEIFGPLSETYKSHAADIHRSGRHLADIVQDILDISRIEAGEMELSEGEIDLYKLFDELSVLDAGSLPGGADKTGGAGITWQVPDGLPKLRGDELRVRQVLINLISNALKFAGGNPIEVGVEASGGTVQFYVQDHGVGISAADMKTLFRPFAQVGGDLAKRRHGTGLGLVVARELMSLHGGTLDLQSELGIGTRAVMRFPPSRTIPV